MSITVEIKECSQPPTWTLSHTHCKKGQQNTEPMSGTGLQTWQSLLWLNFWHKTWCAKDFSYWLFSEAHVWAYSTSVDHRIAGKCWVWMHTSRYFTSLHFTGLGLCYVDYVVWGRRLGERQGTMGYDMIPWLLILTDSFCPDPSIIATTLGQKKDCLVCRVFPFHSSLICRHLVW